MGSCLSYPPYYKSPDIILEGHLPVSKFAGIKGIDIVCYVGDADVGIGVMTPRMAPAVFTMTLEPNGRVTQPSNTDVEVCVVDRHDNYLFWQTDLHVLVYSDEDTVYTKYHMSLRYVKHCRRYKLCNLAAFM